MKKVIITLSIIAALGLNANAQNTQSSDGFFSSYQMEEKTRAGMTLFPEQGQGKDQNAVPLGSGLLLLTGLGVAYAMKSRKDEE